VTQETLADGSVLFTPGLIPGTIAMRLWPDGTCAAIEPMIYTNRIAIAGPLAMAQSLWEDMWCYPKGTAALDALLAWSYPTEKEPTGWIRHPPSGRRRPDGDQAEEYVNG